MAKSNEQIRARSALRGNRSFPPHFGARYPITFDQHLWNFFGDLDHKWSDILPEEVTSDDRGKEHFRQLFRVYDDPETIGMTVLERRLSAELARRNRVRWDRQDVGRITNEIKGELGRLGLLEEGLSVKLSTAIRVGDPDRRNGGRKIAAIVDQTTPEAELLVRTHEVILQGLTENTRTRKKSDSDLGSLKYPSSDYVPKMTLGVVFRDVDPEKLDECVGAAQELLPISGVMLEHIKFFAQQEI